MLPRHVMTRLIDLMQEQEQLMCKLYQTYAQLFAAEKAPWLQLAKAEIEHAAWVETLRENVTDGLAHIDERRLILVDAYEAVTSEVKTEIAQCREKRKQPADAFAAALRLERTMLETDLFAFFEGDSPMLKGILCSLKTGTEKHLQDLEQLIEAEAQKLKKPWL